MSLVEPGRRAAFFRQLDELAARIHAARNIDEIMLGLSADICALFDADRLTIYCLSDDKASMVSKVKTGLASFKQLKLPISADSLAGYAALTRQTLNLRDVYDDAELKSHSAELRFQQGVDRRTGYRTEQVLVAPIIGDHEVLGVVQLINNLRGRIFPDLVVEGLSQLCGTLATAFAQRSQAPALERKRFVTAMRESVLPRAQLEQALRKAEASGADIEDVLLGELGMKLGVVGRALADYFSVPYLAFHPERRKPAQLLEGLSRAAALEQQWIPVEENRHGLYVLCLDPHQARNSGSVARRFPEARPVYCVTTRREFGWMVNQYFGNAPASPAPAGEASLLSVSQQEELARTVSSMVGGAHRHGLSGLRIETTPGEDAHEVRFVVSGVLRLR
ncbi:MAG: GAF domain-containing protein [Massilia sp.]